MPQFLIPSSEVRDRKAVLSGEEAHHARDVFRMKQGDAIQLFDGRGTGYRGVIAALSSKEIEVRIAETIREEPRAAFRSILAQSLVSKEAMDCVVQKATELGIDVIAPVIARRSQIRPDQKRGEEKRQHWEKTALAACKQCDRLTLPRILPVVTLVEWLAGAPPKGRTCYADVAENSVTFESYLAELGGGGGDVAVVIGPEGDFDDTERELFRAKNVRPVSLGSTVLRSDTAALYAASLLRSAGAL